MPGEVASDVVLPGSVVSELDTEPDCHPPICPSGGRLANRSFAVPEGAVLPGGVLGVEVDVVGDGDLGDPGLGRQGGIDVDRNVAVG